jgi:hypothetical protein
MRTSIPHIHQQPSTVDRFLQISIPEPCSEDWNEMSPREQGRFCDKCCKTVLDFSTKSSEEIKNYFLEHMHEKVCGRFRSDQLNKPIIIEIPYNYYVNRLTSSQAFFLSLLIVFGTLLFSCTTHSNRTVEKFDLIETSASDSTVEVPPLTGIIEIDTPMRAVPFKKENSITKTTDECNAIPKPPHELPAVNIDAYQPIIVGGYSSGLTTISIYSHPIIFEDFDSSKAELKEKDSAILPTDAILFPNPAHDVVKLKFHSSSENRTTVEMFDLNGKLIRTLLPSQQLSDGENEFQFDVSGIPPATYLVRIVTGEKLETKRIVVM